MNGTTAPAAGSTSPEDARLRRQVDVNAAGVRAAEAEALLQSQYRNPFAAAGLGLGAASMAMMNPILLQQEMIRQQELDRILAANSRLAVPGHEAGIDLLSCRENELLSLRNAHNQKMREVELACRNPLAAGVGGGFPLTASSMGGLRPGSSALDLGAEARALGAAAMAAASTASQVLSADERDRLSKVADETFRTALAANGLPPAGTLAKTDERLKDIGDKDLAHEAELRDNVQRRLMEQEAMAEQKKKQAASLQLNTALMGGGLDLERAELLRRQQQQEELLRLAHMQQFQLPGDDLLSAQSRMRSAMAMSMINPYSALMGGLGGLPLHIPPVLALPPMIDPQDVAANIEKAYAAKGSPENDIISKFLNEVTSRVPEITDLLAYFFPTYLVNNPEKFRAEFPGVVDATLAELRMMQEKASKENGYKSRGLFDRLTNCIAAITPYKNMLADPISAANFPNARESGSNDALSSKPAAKKAREFSAADTWTCHKCGNDNMAVKARCSTCQGWKGGVRENKPKKRKHLAGEAEKTQKKSRKKKSAVDKETKKKSKDTAYESSSKPAHVLLQKHDGESPKSKALPTKHEEASEPGATNGQIDTEHEDVKMASSKGKTDENKDGGEDHMDAANVLLGFMGGSSGSESNPTA